MNPVDPVHVGELHFHHQLRAPDSSWLEPDGQQIDCDAEHRSELLMGTCRDVSMR